jgi:hypothetical protein
MDVAIDVAMPMNAIREEVFWSISTQDTLLHNPRAGPCGESKKLT